VRYSSRWRDGNISVHAVTREGAVIPPSGQGYMRLKSTELNAALAVVVVLGMSSGCGEDPVSTGSPGDYSFAGTLTGGGNPAGNTGGLAPLGSGGTTGGLSSSGGTPSANTGGLKTGGTGGTLSNGGSSGMKTGTATGGSAGMKTSGTTGGSGVSTGGRGSLGTGGRSSGVGGSTSSGGSASGTGGGAAVAFSAVGSIVGMRCSSCHGFTMPTLQNNAMLRNTLTSTRVPECGNNPLVTPNDTSKSAILMLVNRMCTGVVMPLGCNMTPCIPAAEVTTITNWINAGAPP
jgi:hypothetical protein